MPRWSTRTMLRELREFKREQGLKGDESVDDVIGRLEDKFIEEEMDKSLKPTPKKGKTDASDA